MILIEEFDQIRLDPRAIRILHSVELVVVRNNACLKMRHFARLFDVYLSYQ